MGSQKKSVQDVKVLSELHPKISPDKKLSSLISKIRDGSLDMDDKVSSGLAMSLVSLNQVYPFRLASHQTFATDGSGKSAFSIFVDPSSSGSNFPEYSTIITLFNQVRVRSFEVTFAPAYRSAGTNSYPLIIAGCLTTLGVPTSFTSVVENADSYLYPWQSWTGPPYKHKIKYAPKPVWADVTTPDPGDNVGCPGCIIGYTDTLPASVDYLSVMIVGIYEFRSRT